MADTNRIIDIAVLIHGMTPDQQPSDPTISFKEFWNKVAAHNEKIQQRFRENHVVFVTWGQEPAGHAGPVRQDEKLTRAQLHISDLVKYEHVKKEPGPNDVLMSGLGTEQPKFSQGDG